MSQDALAKASERASKSEEYVLSLQDQKQYLIEQVNALTKERDDLRVERDGRTPSARIIELALRLIEAGPKASHVSCSETHEIADFILEQPTTPNKIR